MDEPTRIIRIESFLDDAGLGALSGTVQQIRVREHSTVYGARLLHDAGDAGIEVFLYDLTEDPAGIVDAEEERIALTELASDLIPQLLAFAFGAEVALLAVAQSNDAARIRRFLDAYDGADEAGELVYQPDVDRMLGADYLRAEDERLTLTCLMSRARAEALFDVSQRLIQATGATADAPCVPLVVAAFEVDPLDAAIRSLDDVPPEYASLAMVTSVISPYEPVGTNALTLDAHDAGLLAIRLFDTIREAHRLPATFSRAAGCSLRPEFIAPTGDILDVYFLTDGSEYADDELAYRQKTDLLNAIHVLCEVLDPGDPQLAAVISVGMDVYTELPVAPPLTGLVEAVARDSEVGTMSILANAVHQIRKSRWGEA